MSQEAIEKLRIKLATNRTKTFQTKLAELLDEMKGIEQTDEFILQALSPAQT